MRISGFNPNMSIETFRTIAKNNETTPEQLEDAIYKALSENNATALSEGLSETVAGKIQELAKARNKNIFNFVKALNGLGDTKDELQETNAIYALKKQARREAKSAYDGISNPNDLEKKVEEIGGKALKAFKDFSVSVACVWSPRDVLGSACELIYMWLQPTKQEEVLEKLKSALKSVFLFEQNEAELYRGLEKYLERFPDGQELLKKNSETLNALVKEAKNEAEKAIEQRASEKEKREVESTEILLDRLSSYQRASQELLGDRDYLEMKAEKQRVYKNLKQLASFCKLEELTSHRKINTDSNLFLYNKTAVVYS
ncbi:MAG: hypothetical protein CK425_00075 [Parachlamydia sp.]|nr:MAG: hypothetical protein CK425_00075 [Parachlamydia sp.]